MRYLGESSVLDALIIVDIFEVTLANCSRGIKHGIISCAPFLFIFVFRFLGTLVGKVHSAPPPK